MACKSMYQEAQSVQLIIFLPTYFNCLLAYRRWVYNCLQRVGVKFPSYFFLDIDYFLFIDLKLGRHTK